MAATAIPSQTWCWARSPGCPRSTGPRDSFGTPGPYEDAVQNTPICEETGKDKFNHSPSFGAQVR